MTASDWVKAKQLFSAWPEMDSSEIQGTIRRLADALAGLRTRSAGWRDITSLTRQILLEASASGNMSPLLVPVTSEMPTVEQWRSSGCEALITTVGTISVSAQPWHPSVSEGRATDAAKADLKEIYLGRDSAQRRSFNDVLGDPFWATALGYDNYYSLGQRQAARSVIMAPPGSTAIVCLPTGHGKTPVALAPTLLGGRAHGGSIVVVPTVVLALDMERRTRDLLEARGVKSPTGRYAFTGDLSEDVKKQLCDDVRYGRQPILFTSPEAVTTTLQRPLDEAAAAGSLRYFIIDEAHLVEQWGNEFRPDFQTMAGQRRNWLRRAPAGREPRTIAMSATLTAQQIETLENLFGAPQATDLVWASQLRTEPSYYIESLPTEVARREAVMHALARLPKPSILYVSTVEAAKDWAALLAESGMRRVIAVTGRSIPEDRREAMEGWGGRDATGRIPTRFDTVIGTSAFGLGIDLSDVKTVVHACMPETVDRYYQEVGRGGRDGSPSLAYMATVQKDIRVAESLNAEIILLPKTAWERWDAMFQRRIPPDADGVYQIDLDSYPARLSMGFKTNRLWNIRALNLMVRTKLVELTSPKAPQQAEDEPHDTWQRRQQGYLESLPSRVDVQLMDGRTNDRDYFLRRIGPTRDRILTSQNSALERLRAAVRGDRCIADVLSDYYVVQRPEGTLETAPACRGCPHCREHQEFPVAGGFYRTPWEPHPPVVKWLDVPSDPLGTFRGPGQTSLNIWWERDDERRDLVPDLVTELCRRGMTIIGGEGISDAMTKRIQRESLPHALIVDSDEDMLTAFRGPLVWILDGSPESMNGAAAERFESSDVTYFIHCRNLEHPSRPGARLIDIHSSNISINRALRSL
ncbi:protein DpdF [Nocardia sp. NBC_01730]|uniref:protein DpdF n=1 Tax=Nocardia sp. NBC_01730 TaxID=2975998 RepID=UPI002E11CBF5|nr:protein DpdF [Nocardia sp. NBC_01730]